MGSDQPPCPCFHEALQCRSGFFSLYSCPQRETLTCKAAVIEAEWTWRTNAQVSQPLRDRESVFFPPGWQVVNDGDRRSTI